MIAAKIYFYFKLVPLFKFIFFIRKMNRYIKFLNKTAFMIYKYKKRRKRPKIRNIYFPEAFYGYFAFYGQICIRKIFLTLSVCKESPNRHLYTLLSHIRVLEVESVFLFFNVDKIISGKGFLKFISVPYLLL